MPRIVSYEEGGSYTQPRGVVLFKTIKSESNCPVIKTTAYVCVYMYGTTVAVNIAVIRQGTRVVELYGI